MNIKNLLTPEVRTFVYGATAAILSVATASNWISADLAKNISDNLPAIIGGLAAIMAAVHVPQKKVTPTIAPAVPLKAPEMAPQPSPDSIAHELPPA